jgi:ABC-type Zn uptake system ZnuABC Zn-binding protein ZnuA
MIFSLISEGEDMGEHTARSLRIGALIVTAVFFAALAAGCVSPASPRHEHMAIPPMEAVDLGGEKLKVVATTNILGNVVANVGGEAIDLTVLIELGQDPHTYQAVAGDLAAIEDAHVVFVVGLNLEESLIDTIDNTASGPVVPVSAGIDLIAFAGGHGHHEGGRKHQAEAAVYDPHFWMDPNNVIVWAGNIANVLSAADPANADAYATNAAAYVKELEALDAYIRQEVARIPEANRKLVTDHLAFGYFADEYGFEMIGTVVPGATTTAEPSAGDMADLVEQIKAEGVKAIFVGTSASERLEQLAGLIAEEAGTEVEVLALYTGSLDEPGTPGATYLDMMRYNIDRMVEGLAD